jgi:hypothetical protein
MLRRLDWVTFQERTQKTGYADLKEKALGLLKLIEANPYQIRPRMKSLLAIFQEPIRGASTFSIEVYGVSNDQHTIKV